MSLSDASAEADSARNRQIEVVTRDNTSRLQRLVEDGIFYFERMKLRMEKKKFYMTTAIAYTSAKPHIGNTYEIVFSDAIARHKRMEG